MTKSKRSSAKSKPVRSGGSRVSGVLGGPVEASNVIGHFGVSPDKLASLLRIAEIENTSPEETLEELIFCGIVDSEKCYLPLVGLDHWDLVRGGFCRVCDLGSKDEERLLFCSNAGELALYCSHIEEFRDGSWHKVEDYLDARLGEVRRFGYAQEISAEDALALILRTKVPPVFHGVLKAAGLHIEEKPASLLSQIHTEKGLNAPGSFPPFAA